MNIREFKALESEIEFSTQSPLAGFENVTGFDITEEAVQLSALQQKFQEAADVVENKAKTLENVAEELEKIEREKESFDEWAKNVKSGFKNGEAFSKNLRVIFTII